MKGTDALGGGGMSMPKKLAIGGIILLLLISAVGGVIAYELVLKGEKKEPVKIGVLLPLTGPDSISSNEVLDWLCEEMNSMGGINGADIELVYADSYDADIKELARTLVEDPDINVVIGPGSSSEVYDIAPMFIAHHKLLISPFSTAGEVFRAFGGQGYFWRTCQSDVAQIRTMLHFLDEKGVRSISLVYEDSIYGKTFYDWAGFFCLELGINITSFITFEPGAIDPDTVVDQALVGDPDYIICVPFSLDAAKIKAELAKRGKDTGLFLSDAAETPYLVKALGSLAEGLEGTSPTADPSTDFIESYRHRFGRTPNNLAAPTYDALLLGLYALAAHERSGADLADSMDAVVKGRGQGVDWDPSSVSGGIESILDGEAPDIRGASGPLEYDEEYGTDPLSTYYAHWQVDRGKFRILERVSSDISLNAGRKDDNASASRTTGSNELRELDKNGASGNTLPPRKDLWAVIVASSSGWDNYRHQADALAIYRMCRDNGLPDNRIILMLEDDLPELDTNPISGDVHHVQAGPNLRENAVVDYSSDMVSVKILTNILLGKSSDRVPDVLGSDSGSDVLFYIVDHGGKGVVSFDNGGGLLGSDLRDVLNTMHNEGRFRQMFMFIETCYSGSMTPKIDTPEVAIMTSASDNEPSFAANYDSDLGIWLADDCTEQFIRLVGGDRDRSVEDTYDSVYDNVAGSHVRLANYNNFTGVSTTPIGDFIAP